MAHTVLIRKGVGMLEVDPDLALVLGPALSYDHRVLDHEGAGTDVSIVSRECYATRNGKLYALPGLEDRVLRTLSSLDIPYRIEDLREPVPELQNPDYDNMFANLNNLVGGTFTDFRVGQMEVISNIVAVDRGQYEAPVAWGKSFIVRAISLLYPEARILVVVPGRQLRNSLHQALLASTPDVGRVDGSHCQLRRITVSTPQSVLKADPNSAHILLFDEVHAAGASSLDPDNPTDSIADKLSQIVGPTKWIGFSATPEGRSDGAHMVIEAMFGPIRHRVTYQEALEDNAVARIRVAATALTDAEVNKDAATAVESYSGRASRKRHCYWRNQHRNRRLLRLVDTVTEQYKLEDPQVLILVETFEHLAFMSQLVPDYELVYDSVEETVFRGYQASGQLRPELELLTPKRREELRRGFEKGTLRRVIATKVWGTGMDFTKLDILVAAGGEASEIPVIQGSGRVARGSLGFVVDVADKFNSYVERRFRTRVRLYKSRGWELTDPEATPGSYRSKRRRW